MSIIQEALRKAQKIKVVREVEAPKSAITAEAKRFSGAIENAKGAKSKNMLKSALYAFFFLLLLSLLAVKYFSTIPVKATAARQAPVAEPYQAAQPKVSPSIFDAQPLFLLPKQPAAEVQSVPVKLHIPEVQPLPKQDDFVLSGIMHLEDGPRAIVNGTTVMEGDIIDGAAVTKIMNNSVVLKKKNLEIVLHLE